MIIALQVNRCQDCAWVILLTVSLGWTVIVYLITAAILAGLKLTIIFIVITFFFSFSLKGDTTFP